jgi:hypothetical protein
MGWALRSRIVRAGLNRALQIGIQRSVARDPWRATRSNATKPFSPSDEIGTKQTVGSVAGVGWANWWGRERSGWVMVTRQLSIAIAFAISFFIGLGMTQPDLETFAAAPASPASVTRIDFDQAFADAAPGAVHVDRAHKGDRSPKIKAVSAERVLPNCEPVASPYSDPILGRVVGRCDA